MPLLHQSRELHSIITESAGSYEDAVVFSPDTLSFDSCDTAQVQLIQPIKQGRMRFPRCLTPQHPAFGALQSAFMDILHTFRRAQQKEAFQSETFQEKISWEQPIQNELPGDLSAVTDDLTSQLYIKASLLFLLATLSEHRLFTPTEADYDKRVEDIKAVLTYIKDNYRENLHLRPGGADQPQRTIFLPFFQKSHRPHAHGVYQRVPHQADPAPAGRKRSAHHGYLSGMRLQ